MAQRGRGLHHFLHLERFRDIEDLVGRTCGAADVEQRFAELQVIRLRADWTSRDAAISAALARMNRSGVPVYALYSPSQREPALLPEVLTRSIVLEALQGAAARAARAPMPSSVATPTSVARKESP